MGIGSHTLRHLCEECRTNGVTEMTRWNTMKTAILLLSLLFLSSSELIGCRQEVDTQDFSIDVKVPSSAPLGGPIPLELKVSYKGRNEVEISSLDSPFLNLSFHSPMGWDSVKRDPRRILFGRLPLVKLANGESLSRVLYLHDFFSKMTPGRMELPLTLKIWPEAGSAKNPIILKKTIVVEIERDSADQLEARIRSIASRIAQEKAEERLELYRSLGSLSHRELTPIFVQALSDVRVRAFHLTARKRLIDLCEAEGNWDPIVRYLAVRGTRYDFYFFTYLQGKKINLSLEQRSALNNASNIWIRLYALEFFSQEQEGKFGGLLGSFEGLLGSLKGEIKDLTDRVTELERKNKPIGSNDESSMKQQARLAATSIEDEVPSAELEDLLTDMTGSDPMKAKKAVRRLASIGGTRVVAVALKYPASSVQIEAAKQLKRTEDKDVLPRVIAALETANADLVKGGTEVVLANRELKRNLVEVIGNITKLDFGSVSVRDTEAIQNVIESAKEWMQSHQNDSQ